MGAAEDAFLTRRPDAVIPTLSIPRSEAEINLLEPSGCASDQMHGAIVFSLQVIQPIASGGNRLEERIAGQDGPDDACRLVGTCDHDLVDVRPALDKPLHESCDAILPLASVIEG